MATMKIKIGEITGLVLAGGLGSRMGGADKGLQIHLGLPLAQHALRRLALQVGKVMINANRNIAEYEKMGSPVLTDEVGNFAGPLAGILAGLKHCDTPYLATVPCDTPNFPYDLVERLSRGLVGIGGTMAMAFTPEGAGLRRQSVFSLMHVSTRESAIAFVRSGQGNLGLWASQQRCAQVVFEDESAFFNANTFAELARLQDNGG